jgi:DNA-binding response OmpR family regulator
MAAILLVAEDSSVIRFLRDALESQGHQVLVGQPGTGSTAITASLNVNFDILIVDAPEADPTGSETGAWLSQLMPQTPVIVLSDEPSAIAGRPGWRLLAKPFRARALLHLISEIFPPAS